MKLLAKSERMGIHISNIANVVLFAVKIFASIEGRSLSVIASTLDSLLDLLSGFILWFTAHAMRNPNQYRYPIGKKWMQLVVSHLIQQLWGCIWKYHYAYLNFKLSLPAISLISFTATRGVARNKYLEGPGCNRDILNIILKSIGYKIINFHISSYTWTCWEFNRNSKLVRNKKIEKTKRQKKNNHTHKTVFMWFGNLPMSTEL